MKPDLPAYLDHQLTEQYGSELAAEILSGFAAARPVTLRVNPLRSTMEEVMEALHGIGAQTEAVPFYADALIVRGTDESAVATLPVYSRGGIYLQGLTAMLPALALEPKAGESILDMCAAPGGKTAQLAALSGGNAVLTACERDSARCERLRFNLERQGVARVSVLNQDARRLDDFFRFDKILLDAPCTGSGTVDLRDGARPRRMEPAWVDKTVRTQKALIAKAARLLSGGGTLVYATCSILACENDDVVRYALTQGLAVDPLPESLVSSLELLPCSVRGAFCLKPTALQEGFFCCRLKKV